MPAICESLSAALTTNLNSLKDDKNFDNQLIVSTKRVLLSKIEYVPVQNYNSTILNNLKTKYIVLKSNSSPLLNLNGQNGHNGKHINASRSHSHFSYALRKTQIISSCNKSSSSFPELPP